MPTADNHLPTSSCPPSGHDAALHQSEVSIYPFTSRTLVLPMLLPCPSFQLAVSLLIIDPLQSLVFHSFLLRCYLRHHHFPNIYHKSCHWFPALDYGSPLTQSIRSNWVVSFWFILHALLSNISFPPGVHIFSLAVSFHLHTTIDRVLVVLVSYTRCFLLRDIVYEPYVYNVSSTLF